jgi:hypothetical protein
MARYSSRWGLGLGIVQIVIGVWFLVMVGLLVKYMNWCCEWVDRKGLELLVPKYTPEWITIPDAIPRGSILTFTFIFSGSLTIAAAKKKTMALEIASLGFSTLSSITAFVLLALSIGEFVSGDKTSVIVGLPSLILFIVTTISAINNSDIRVWGRSQPAQVITNNGPPMGDKYMGTQYENVDMESAAENNPTTEELSLRSSLKKYFRLGVRISDPLLNFVKWIAYITEIGTAVVVPLLLSLRSYVFLLNERWYDAGTDDDDLYVDNLYLDLVIFAIESTICGLIAFSYAHIMCVKPSRHLLCGLQQLSARKFVPWMLTTLIHSLPTAYFCFTERVILQHCIEKYREELVEYDPEDFLPQSCYERRLRPDLSCWVVGCLVILAPQVVVLVAVVRVARLKKENVSHLVPSPTSSASAQPDPSEPQ